ncbi:MAG: Ferric siderophore transport system, periplasmic binding protein TonB [Candidatus Ozemobacter sibiricus]|jgi:protein TonB|uniref:Ferric siderophore transport system, periplasmic binding protein TonB n=1 Tax=Candidatus Ozemobacter sibiricus TaxID=2268124 RepID=A0A367ZRI1_9BACT|nr:MAG: Ferric siderophore transport system, periplasmic binding protein TonB [Candidatus Ozemobacter sibiricus]
MTGEHRPTLVLVHPEEDGREEFTASLLLHLALLLAMTAWFALRGPYVPPTPTVHPVRLVGPLSVPRPGSSTQPQPETGSRQARGDASRQAKGRQTDNRRLSPPVPSAPKVKAPVRPKNPQAKTGSTTRPGPRTNTETTKPTAVQDTPTGFRDTKPYIPAPAFDDVSHALTEPTPPTPLSAPLAGGELGDPLEMEMPSEMTAAPLPHGTGDREAPPSGAADPALATVGGGEVEVAGLESLGGGEERFAPPKILSKVLPEYPEWARKQGIRGQATYKVLVQPAGTVGDVLTMASTIDPKLAILGAQALRRWVFSPVLVNGEPRETWVMLTVQFKLH